MPTIGLLMCDQNSAEIRRATGSYDSCFRYLLESSRPCYWQVRIWRCPENQLPDQTEECDGWIISGSRASTYDNAPWIEKLKAFVRKLDRNRTPLVGICFGHQLVHSALGGDIRLHTQGWGLGPYPLTLQADFAGFPARYSNLRVPAIHKDQVYTMAAGFRVIAGSDFCRFGITRKDDYILTVQPHPEFNEAIFRYICERRVESLGEHNIQVALKAMQKSDDRTRVRQAIEQFLYDTCNGKS